jgi:hypothetical protein
LNLKFTTRIGKSKIIIAKRNNNMSDRDVTGREGEDFSKQQGDVPPVVKAMVYPPAWNNRWCVASMALNTLSL